MAEAQLKTGDEVRVWPHGREQDVAIGTVLIISANERSIAVGFDDKPPFGAIAREGYLVHPAYGLVMLAVRETVGPWVEIIGDGHYEIEAI